MRIAFVDVTVTVSYGGVQTCVWELARHLDSMGMEVHVYGGRGRIMPSGLPPSIKVFTFPFIPRERVPDLGSRFRRIVERLSMAVYAGRELKGRGYDLIVLTKPFDFFLPFLIGRGSRYAFISGGTDFFAGDRRLSRGIDHWFSVSHFNAYQIFSHYKRYPKVIYNGVDVERFRALPCNHGLKGSLGLEGEEKVLIYAGRLVGWKGVRFAVEAVGHPLLRELPVKLLIVGDGPERGRLEELASRMGVRERVIFHGFVPHHELPAYYSIADIGVYPSIGDEAFGISIAEAMACGRPVVASHIGGIPEVVGTEETCGFLVSPTSSEEIARKINLLVRNPERRIEMGRMARERIAGRFTWRMAAERFLEGLGER